MEYNVNTVMMKVKVIFFFLFLTYIKEAVDTNSHSCLSVIRFLGKFHYVLHTSANQAT